MRHHNTNLTLSLCFSLIKLKKWCRKLSKVRLICQCMHLDRLSLLSHKFFNLKAQIEATHLWEDLNNKWNSILMNKWEKAKEQARKIKWVVYLHMSKNIQRLIFRKIKSILIIIKKARLEIAMLTHNRCCLFRTTRIQQEIMYLIQLDEKMNRWTVVSSLQTDKILFRMQ